MQRSNGGPMICHRCREAKEIAGIPFLQTDWERFEDINWDRIVINYELLGREQLRLFAEQQGEDTIYGLVFQLSQNYLLEIHINTLSGIEGIPGKMRQIANWGQELSDDGWREKVGLWYTPAWKFDCLGMTFQGELSAVDDFHYRLFEELHDDSGGGAQLDEARLKAIAAIQSSPEYASILKAVNFRSYIVDDDGLEYHTKAHIGS